MKHFWLVVLVLLLAAFLRLYRISEYMTFLGDEGRDALVIKDLLVNHHIPAIGPTMSVGNVYLGPLYYYMMAFAMAIWWLHPAAAAVMCALIGVATTGLIYYISARWFGFWSGIVASFLYAISFVTVTYARSSWNPNPMPFFALLSIISIYQAVETKNYSWLILVGLFISAAVQMHFLGLILIPIVGILGLLELLKIKHKQSFLLNTIGAIAAFFILQIPWILFELKHNFMNTKNMIELFTGSKTPIAHFPFANLMHIFTIYMNSLIGRYIGGDQLFVTALLTVIITLILGYFALLFVHKRASWPQTILLIWIVVGVLGLSLYQGEVYDHYVGFISPAVFMVLGSLASLSFKPLRHYLETGKIVLLVLLVGVVGWVNIQKNPLQTPPNRQLQRTYTVSEFIANEAGGKPFNFALLSKNNYDAAYQFVLGQLGASPAKLPDQKTDQLFVVCEDPVCEPVTSPKYEIAAFGWVTIEKMDEVAGVKVFKLVHNPAQEKVKL
jgi:4-amino-4-deoxy-L-arabinose transferase-like glycosyltransferase